MVLTTKDIKVGDVLLFRPFHGHEQAKIKVLKITDRLVEIEFLEVFVNSYLYFYIGETYIVDPANLRRL